jgi:transposase
MQGVEWTPAEREVLERELFQTQNADMRIRLLALLHVGEGQSVAEVARWLHVDRRTVYRWVVRFCASRQIEGLEDHRGQGRPRNWSDALGHLLQSALTQSPIELGYPANTWTVPVLHAYLAVYLPQQAVSARTVRRRLKDLGYVWKRFRYVLAPDPEAEKKTQDSGANSSFASGNSPFGGG